MKDNGSIFDQFNFYNITKLKEKFGGERMEEKYNSLIKCMEKFIIAYGLGDYVVVNRSLLSGAILDYYDDVIRLKEFHNIEKINSIKVMAYMAYWILRRRPLQIEKSSGEKEVERVLITINERFVLQYLCDYLSVVDDKKGHLFEREEDGLNSFNDMLLYYLIYRFRDAQSLEMVLMAFFAGQIYENKDKDLTKIFHPYDSG